VGQQRANLQADIPIEAVRPVVDGVQHIRRSPDVLHRQRLVDVVRRRAAGDQGLYGPIVVVALGDGLLEDRRVGRHPQYAPLKQRLELPGIQEATANIVIPDRLAQRGQFMQFGHTLVSG